jgi:hypothetical protein
MNEILHTWVDTTTYSRGDKDRVPSCWTYYTGKLTITIFNTHRVYAGQWLINCPELSISNGNLNLQSETPVQIVQKRAINSIKKYLNKMIASIDAQKQNTTEK